jgi:hypothetical protein
MLRQIPLTLVVLGACSTTLPAHAQWEFAIGAGARRASVTETSATGTRLVQEEGWLPGIEASARHAWHDWNFTARAQTYRGDISYEGALQTGAPFSTTTDTAQNRIGLEAARALNDSVRWLAGLEWDQWRRRIHGRGAVLGITEHTASWRLLTGLEATLPMQVVASRVTLRGLLVAAAPERLSVQFDRHLYDDASLTTQSATGARLSAEFAPVSLPRLSIVTEFDWLRIGRSDNAALYYNGTPIGTLVQPEHRRSAFSLAVRYRF